MKTLNLKLSNQKIFIGIAVMMVAFCLSLTIFRFQVTSTKTFLFLNWNLFLATIPLVISSLVSRQNFRGKFPLFILIFSWILFFPNSPYILTDLFHLRARPSVPVWYDLIVIVSFAWTGLIFGFASLMQIEKLMRQHFTPKIVEISIVIFIFLSSFGVYLGRFQRWNSWDIVNRPISLFQDIASRFLFPMEHLRTWGVTILLGILLNLMYASLKFIKKI